MRHFIKLSYKGTAYHGWQRQINAPSVQATVELALSTILREPIEVTGAGRTDTGVHAAHYVAHFDTANEIESANEFCYHLNALLPNDIAVQQLHRVADDAHARFDAVEREYKYYIMTCKDPFTREITWQYSTDLDVEAMNSAADRLLTHSDFTTFSKLHSNNKTNICKVTHARWVRSGNELVFTIRADRFLRNMVRSIVGTLVDVGRGKISEKDFAEALESLDRGRASGSAPAQGLFLTDVKY